MKRVTVSVMVVVLVMAIVILSCSTNPRVQLDPGPTGLADFQTPLSAHADFEKTESVRHESAAFALVEDMKAGWNLGNALDSLDHQKNGINTQLKTVTPEEYYETLWGNPVTTSKTISDVAEMGFGAVRIPVTWQDHMDDEYTISTAWLERVKQVVDDVLGNNMYCIINLHHDVGAGVWPWLRAEPEQLDEHKENLRTVWAQIATFFRDYSDKLLFESFNEILDTSDRWTNSTSEAYDAVNELNQVFVDTVRETGGMNTDRFLIVTPYAASVDSGVLSRYRLPEDTAEDRLIASVHTYAPAGFAWHENMATWTKVFSVWYEEKCGWEIEAMLQSLRTNLIEKGIPVIISECAAWNKNNTADRIAYAEFLVREAVKDQITCFWWDEGGKEEKPEEIRNSALYDRHNEVWLFPEVAKAFTGAADDAWGAGKETDSR